MTHCRPTEEPQNIHVTRYQEDKQSKATSSLFPIKMIAKLERTQSTAQQNMDQTQNPTIGATANNEFCNESTYHTTNKGQTQILKIYIESNNKQ